MPALHSFVTEPIRIIAHSSAILVCTPLCLSDRLWWFYCSRVPTRDRRDATGGRGLSVRRKDVRRTLSLLISLLLTK